MSTQRGKRDCGQTDIPLLQVFIDAVDSYLAGAELMYLCFNRIEIDFFFILIPKKKKLIKQLAYLTHSNRLEDIIKYRVAYMLFIYREIRNVFYRRYFA